MFAVDGGTPPHQLGPSVQSVLVPPSQFPGAVTDTVVVYTVAGAQPGFEVPLVTVRAYTLVTVGVAVGFCTVVDDRLGPLQA